MALAPLSRTLILYEGGVNPHPTEAITVPVGPGTPPPPPKLVALGDSLTAGTGPTPYADQYAAANPDLAFQKQAQGSRTVGTSANLNDGGNSMFGHLSEIPGFEATHATTIIGANDFTTGTVAAYRTDITNFFTALKAASADTKFIWSGPAFYNPTGTPHPQKANFDAQRAALFAGDASGARNPAVWGQWCDIYWPGGEYPDFGDPALAAPLFGDGVHWTAAGQTLILASYAAVVDTALDATRANATEPYEAAWPIDPSGLPANTAVTLRLMVSGIAPAGLSLGASVAGADAQLRLNGGAYAGSVGTGSGNGYRIYNGDVLDIRVTTSASPSTPIDVELTIGSETRTISFTTTAAVPDIMIVDGGEATRTSYAGPTSTFAARPFDTGVGVVMLSLDGAMTATTVGAQGAVTVGGVPFTLGRRDGYNEVWFGPVAAGNRDIVVTQSSGQKGKIGVLWLTLKNADPTPIDSGVAHNADVPPWPSAAKTVPTKGMAISFINIIGLGSAPAIGIWGGIQPDEDSVLIRQGFVTVLGDGAGYAVAARDVSGATKFTSTSGFGDPWISTLVFKAEGT